MSLLPCSLMSDEVSVIQSGFLVVSMYSLTSYSTHKSSFLVRVFPANHLATVLTEQT